MTYPLTAFLESLGDIHITTLKAGHVRGNHYHARHREVLLIVHSNDWDLHWDEGPQTVVQRQEFHGSGVICVTVEPGASHAIRNTGNGELVIIGLGDLPYDTHSPDSYPR